MMQAFHRHNILPNPSTERPSNAVQKRLIKMAKTAIKLEKIQVGSNVKRAKTTHTASCNVTHHHDA